MADPKLVASYKEKLLYAPDYVLPEDATSDMVEAYEEAKGVKVEKVSTAKAKPSKKSKKK